MKVRNLENKEIVEIYTNTNKFGVGDIILIFLEGGIAILIKSFFGKYYELVDNRVLIESSFHRIDKIRRPLFLEDILTIEGVATYVKLSNGSIIHLSEEIEDIERFAYYKTIEMLTPSKNVELYTDVLNDIKEADEMILEKK